jgi:hypothetical protein
MDITRPKRINTVASHDQRTVIVTAFPDARSFNPLSAIPRKTRRFDLPVAEVNLQNPVTGPALLIERTHQSVALGMNVQRHLVVRGFSYMGRVSFYDLEREADVFAQFVLFRIGARNEGAAKICFPPFEYRPRRVVD